MKRSCLFQGVARRVQGPVQRQVTDFCLVFVAGAAFFPLGNILGGAMVDKAPSACLYLATATLILAMGAVTPFTENVWSLAVATAASEFALGRSFRYWRKRFCLRLWSDSTKAASVFSSLHVAQASGFLLSPLLADFLMFYNDDGSVALDHRFRHVRRRSSLSIRCFGR